MTELQRNVRATPDSSELAVARSLLASWEVEQRACAGRGVAWSAYRNGGVAELRSILSQLVSESMPHAASTTAAVDEG